MSVIDLCHNLYYYWNTFWTSGRDNEAFFKQKPTDRKLTSQHPYAEEFIGEPHVYTVDITNYEQVEYAMKEIKSKSVSKHCVKSIHIWSFSGPYFPAFGLNTDQKNSEYGHFSRSTN